MLIEGSYARTPPRAVQLHETPLGAARAGTGGATPVAARHLPQMVLATTLVALVPLAASFTLRALGVISSPWLSVALTVGLSLAASSAGSAYWRKRGGAGDLLFSELLVWGWVRRWRQERELTNASRLLELASPDGAARAPLSTERRQELLAQLSRALEGQDVYLNGHSRRVARHAMMIARGMGLSAEEVARIRAAAAIHDVGKLLTPTAILNKPGRLTDDEFDVIKRHPVDGAEMVAALGDPKLTRIVRHHHERLDGAGYPDCLAGDQIPLGARIIAVADTFDAITSARPYRGAARHQKAIAILRAEAGTQLDPGAVRAFLAYYSGKRPTAVWALGLATVRRIFAWLSGDPAAAATISTSKLAAATAATVAIGAAAGGAPVPVVHNSRPSARIHRVIPTFHVATERGNRIEPPVSAPAPIVRAARSSRPGKVIHRTRNHARAPAHTAPVHPAVRRAVPVAAHPNSIAPSPSPSVSPRSGAGATSPAASNTTPPPAITTPSAPTTTAAATPSPATTSSPSASTPVVQPAQPTPPGHTHHGNGNGSGDGNAYGHDNNPGNSNSNSNGNGNGNGDGNGHGNGHRNGNG